MARTENFGEDFTTVDQMNVKNTRTIHLNSIIVKDLAKIYERFGNKIITVMSKNPRRKELRTYTVRILERYENNDCEVYDVLIDVHLKADVIARKSIVYEVHSGEYE